MSTIALYTHRYIGLRNSCWAEISVFLMVIYVHTPLAKTPRVFWDWSKGPQTAQIQDPNSRPEKRPGAQEACVFTVNLCFTKRM